MSCKCHQLHRPFPHSGPLMTTLCDNNQNNVILKIYKMANHMENYGNNVRNYVSTLGHQFHCCFSNLVHR